MKIGFFDSGMGGKIVARNFNQYFPEYSIVVSDDVENMPYGNKSNEILEKLFITKISELFNNDCSIVVVACNTLSVRLVDHVQQSFVTENFPDRQLIGIVMPTVMEIAASPESSFLVLGTQGTVSSGRYEQECAERCPDKNISMVAVADLATLIEQGAISEAEELAKEVITNIFKDHTYDVIVLGCTHYILLEPFLSKLFPGVRIMCQDSIMTQYLLDYLKLHPEIEQSLEKSGKIDYL